MNRRSNAKILVVDLASVLRADHTDLWLGLPRGAATQCAARACPIAFFFLGMSPPGEVQTVRTEPLRDPINRGHWRGREPAWPATGRCAATTETVASRRASHRGCRPTQRGADLVDGCLDHRALLALPSPTSAAPEATGDDHPRPLVSDSAAFSAASTPQGAPKKLVSSCQAPFLSCQRRLTAKRTFAMATPDEGEPRLRIVDEISDGVLRDSQPLLFTSWPNSLYCWDP